MLPVGFGRRGAAAVGTLRFWFGDGVFRAKGFVPVRCGRRGWACGCICIWSGDCCWRLRPGEVEGRESSPLLLPLKGMCERRCFAKGFVGWRVKGAAAGCDRESNGDGFEEGILLGGGSIDCRNGLVGRGEPLCMGCWNAGTPF